MNDKGYVTADLSHGDGILATDVLVLKMRQPIQLTEGQWQQIKDRVRESAERELKNCMVEFTRENLAKE